MAVENQPPPTQPPSSTATYKDVFMVLGSVVGAVGVLVAGMMFVVAPVNNNLLALQGNMGANSKSIEDLTRGIRERDRKTDTAIGAIDELKSVVRAVQDDVGDVDELSQTVGDLKRLEEKGATELNEKLGQLAERIATIEGKLDILISIMEDRVAE